MDATDYILLYYEDPIKFINAIGSRTNEEVLIALEKMIVKRSLDSDAIRQACFDKIWFRLRHHICSNRRLERVFVYLLTKERFPEVESFIKHYEKVFDLDPDPNVLLNEKQGKVDDATKIALRIIRCVMEKKELMEVNNEFFVGRAIFLCDKLFNTSDVERATAILEILKQVAEANRAIGEIICDKVWDRYKFRTESVAILSVTYLFSLMCLFATKGINDLSVFRKYFDPSKPGARIYGLYMIRMLLDHYLLPPEDTEDFKTFVLITESLEEPYHILEPILNLLPSLKLKQYDDCIHVLLQMIIAHDSSLVRNWGLSYFLKDRTIKLDDPRQKDLQHKGQTDREDTERTIFILGALNTASLYDVDNPVVTHEMLSAFISRHFRRIFSTTAEINWSSVPFYCVLKALVECIKSLDGHCFDIEFLNILGKQTELIPKRLACSTIRSQAQVMYTEIIEHIEPFVGIAALIPVMKNVFEIAGNHDQLGGFISNKAKANHFGSLKGDLKFIKFVFNVLISNKTSAEIVTLKETLMESECVDFIMEPIYHLSKTEDEGIQVLVDELSVITMATITDIVTKNLEDPALPRLMTALELELLTMETISTRTQEQLEIICELLKCKPNFLESRYKFLRLMVELRPKLELRDDKLPDIEDIEKHVFGNAIVYSDELLLCQLALLRYQIETNGSLKDVDFLRFVSCFDCYLLTEQRNSFSKLMNVVKTMLTEEYFKVLTETQLLETIMLITKLRDKMITKITGRISLDIKMFSEVLLASIEFPSASNRWINAVSDVIESAMSILEKRNQSLSTFTFVLINAAEKSEVVKKDNHFRNFAKRFLSKILTSVEKFDRIEAAVSCKIEEQFGTPSSDRISPTAVEKKTMRVRAAQILSSKFSEEFSGIIEVYMQEFKKITSKRYFSNDYVHRFKLYCLQPMIFGKELTPETIDILRSELVNANNQPNVTYLLEIILARHCSNIIDLLCDPKVVERLKSPALKSIIAITVLREKMPESLKSVEDFDITVKRIEKIHDVILSHMMGQNYGVRSYAQAALVTLEKHWKSQFAAQRSPAISAVSRTCKAINESVQFKNAAKYFDKLKLDFRFELTFEKLWRVDTFYHHIPYLTKSSAVDVISIKTNNDVDVFNETDLSEFKTSIEDEPETFVGFDDLEISPAEDAPSTSAELNFQQKYVPYKYQMPGDKLMAVYSNRIQERKTGLIVVASLITSPQNLGGLARTCEIFGVDDFLISSLKLSENPNFTSLSMTAQKWMRITELQSHRVFCYLRTMKARGYCIVGAEQSASSVSLVDAPIPRKSVLLLGNEKIGIPANLLSLLDLTVEIPQSGVVRSLNVHVSGAVVIWEYAKQHMTKKSPWDANCHQ